MDTSKIIGWGLQIGTVVEFVLPSV